MAMHRPCCLHIINQVDFSLEAQPVSHEPGPPSHCPGISSSSMEYIPTLPKSWRKQREEIVGKHNGARPSWYSLSRISGPLFAGLSLPEYITILEDVNHSHQQIPGSFPISSTPKSVDNRASSTLPIVNLHSDTSGNVDSNVSPENELSMFHNVIVFGEGGVGKSSLINMIADPLSSKPQMSSNAVGCTFIHEAYSLTVHDQTFFLWDTPGLDEGSFGTVPAAKAKEELQILLRQLASTSGIDLVMYCIRGTRVRKALLQNYKFLCSVINRKVVPVVLVVTGLENCEGEMDDWWTQNESELKRCGMQFDGHACVTTLDACVAKHPIIQNRREESYNNLRDLILQTYGPHFREKSRSYMS
ncbi:P-loop containing nucleoside triphosphate hydrolase protein [Hygrophoropsis aurantiaca]|uniref:P-loop containing nucleoside triphosphate hydrolase protein n=1 Tax=Hygrophoropsis aurantiaca TaxID=72124 RepID=A0ACB8AT45_9AGAM|nr:P-loop containing nucleoside triphosphate hydrolase protein [Hygrophoropsis aurantiaca]